MLASNWKYERGNEWTEVKKDEKWSNPFWEEMKQGWKRAVVGYILLWYDCLVACPSNPKLNLLLNVVYLCNYSLSKSPESSN